MLSCFHLGLARVLRVVLCPIDFEMRGGTTWPRLWPWWWRTRRSRLSGGKQSCGFFVLFGALLFCFFVFQAFPPLLPEGCSPLFSRLPGGVAQGEDALLRLPSTDQTSTTKRYHCLHLSIFSDLVGPAVPASSGTSTGHRHFPFGRLCRSGLLRDPQGRRVRRRSQPGGGGRGEKTTGGGRSVSVRRRALS